MAEQTFPAVPFSSAGGRVITSPFQFILTGEDNLRLVVANALVGVRVTVQGRRLDDRGKVLPFSFEFVPTSDRLATSVNLVLGVGAILNLTVFASSGTPLSGQTYVMVQLIRGIGAPAIVLGTLLGGYITHVQALGWPGSPIAPSTEGEPYIRIIHGTSPPNGTVLLETVPTNTRWQVSSFTVSLVTDAVVVNRELYMFASFSGSFVWEAYPARLQPAGQTVLYVFAATVGRQIGLVAQNVVQGIPADLWLPAGAQLIVNAENLQGNDSLLSGGYAVRELLEVA